MRLNAYGHSMSSAKLIIRGLKTLSPVGCSSGDWRGALAAEKSLSSRPQSLAHRPVFSLAPSAETLVENSILESGAEKLDRTTVLALTCARETLRFLPTPEQLELISIGCSRGPTQSLESALEHFRIQSGRVAPLTSPTTTAGALSSTVAQYLLSTTAKADAAHSLASITTSMTCSSAFHSLLVAASFVRSGFARVALFGGAEACLTPFTLAQLEALRIYSQVDGDWPCRPFSLSAESSNSVTLGEGAGTALLLHGSATHGSATEQQGDLALLGLGWALERVPSATGITTEGAAFVASMTRAKESLESRTVDMVIAHAPGSRKGDEAELHAIERVFGDTPVCTTKHVTGHTFGASGMLSLSMAQALLSGCTWPGLPYSNLFGGSPTAAKPPQTIAVNTAGFGGNAITVIVGGLTR
jgi:3-oxoacyl-(acyl-carrier-protein) synthase